eukprot:Clim_evm5s8 gene=Clim_evmTU5s8
MESVWETVSETVNDLLETYITGPGPILVWFDADFGALSLTGLDIDDEMAFLYLLGAHLDPSIPVRILGVSAAAGNVSQAQSVRSLERLKSLVDLSPEIKFVTQANPHWAGVEIAAHISSADRAVTFVSVGSLGNLAAALDSVAGDAEIRLKKRLRRLLWMGGDVNQGPYGIDLNSSSSGPEAMSTVLRKGPRDRTFVTKDFCLQITLPRSSIDTELRAACHCDGKAETVIDKQTGERTVIEREPSAMCALLNRMHNHIDFAQRSMNVNYVNRKLISANLTAAEGSMIPWDITAVALLIEDIQPSTNATHGPPALPTWTLAHGWMTADVQSRLHMTKFVEPSDVITASGSTLMPEGTNRVNIPVALNSSEQELRARMYEKICRVPCSDAMLPWCKGEVTVKSVPAMLADSYGLTSIMGVDALDTSGAPSLFHAGFYDPLECVWVLIWMWPVLVLLRTMFQLIKGAN